MSKTEKILVVFKPENGPVFLGFFPDEEKFHCIEFNKKIFSAFQKMLKKIIKKEKLNDNPEYVELAKEALNEIAEGWEERKKQDKEDDKALNDLMSFFMKGMLVKKYGLDVLSPEEKKAWEKG